MMTPQQAVAFYLMDPRPSEVAMAEIQAYARAGMVPIEDVRPVILLICKDVWPLSDLGDHLLKLRAKHPNLFTP